MPKTRVVWLFRKKNSCLPFLGIRSEFLVLAIKGYTNISDNVGVSFLSQQTAFQEKNLVEQSVRSNFAAARYSSVNSYP